MTIAPTGAGKGVSCVIPAILRHDGPVVVMDVKGENYAITHRHRRSLGSAIHCIDPFGVAAAMEGSDAADISGFNPFDLLPYLSDDEDTACRALADIILSKTSHTADPFWRDASVGVLAGLIQCYSHLDGASRSLAALVADLGQETPGSKWPGHIPREAFFMAALAHDQALRDWMDKYALAPHTVLAEFQNCQRGGGWAPSPREVKALITEAVTAALKERAATHTDIEAIALLAAEEAVDPIHAFDRFAAKMERHVGVDSDAFALCGALWDLCEAASDPFLREPPPGSYGASHDPTQPPAENYPLALHRAALHPTSMCRSVAAQPFTTDRTWGSILCVLRSELAEFSGNSVARTLGGPNSLNLESLWRGDDQSVYIVFPPARIRSHAGLFRCIVEGLLGVILARTHRPQQRTLFLLDEIAQLGTLSFLITAKTLLRGYGVQVWTFWQDIAQLRANYPRDWQTILNNCRVVQAFGRGTGVLTQELSQALDIAPALIADLKAQDMLVWADAQPVQTLRRPISYADPCFAPLCDPGPFAPQRTRTPIAPPRFKTARQAAPYTPEFTDDGLLVLKPGDGIYEMLDLGAQDDTP